MGKREGRQTSASAVPMLLLLLPCIDVGTVHAEVPTVHVTSVIMAPYAVC